MQFIQIPGTNERSMAMYPGKESQHFASEKDEGKLVISVDIPQRSGSVAIEETDVETI